LRYFNLFQSGRLDYALQKNYKQENIQVLYFYKH